MAMCQVKVCWREALLELADVRLPLVELVPLPCVRQISSKMRAHQI